MPKIDIYKLDMDKLDHINEQQSELLQDALITFCDGLPDKLVSLLCQAVVDYQKSKANNVWQRTIDKTIAGLEKTMAGLGD